MNISITLVIVCAENHALGYIFDLGLVAMLNTCGSHEFEDRVFELDIFVFKLIERKLPTTSSCKFQDFFLFSFLFKYFTPKKVLISLRRKELLRMKENEKRRLE